MHPPPPYDDAGSELDSGVAGGQDASIRDRLQAPLEDWMNEKSREELSGLLLAAGSMIKDRETGACPPCPHSRAGDVGSSVHFPALDSLLAAC